MCVWISKSRISLCVFFFVVSIKLQTRTSTLLVFVVFPYIEDGFNENKITGTVFVDLTAAYDIVNHRILLLKVARMTHDAKIVRILQSLLSNRTFYVEMDGQNSFGESQRNGLPQGSVLIPTLFNIYTHDQTEFDQARLQSELAE